MKKIVDVVKVHPRIARYTLYTSIVVGVFLVVHDGFETISGPSMAELFTEVPRPILLVTVVGGTLAFTAAGAYDIFASRHFGVKTPIRASLKIGWVTQTLSNFAGSGGLTGGTIRVGYYAKAGADKDTTLEITLAVWAPNLIGLFVMPVATSPFAIKYDHGSLWIVPLVMSLHIPLYFWGGKLEIGKIDLSRSPFALQNFRQKTRMAFASLFGWIAADVCFWACVLLFVPGVDLWLSLFIYSTGTLVSLISFIPGGLGTFDLTVATLFKSVGYDTMRLLLVIIVCRVCYYTVPWILASLYGASGLLASRIGLGNKYKREGTLVTVLWIGTLPAGVVLITSVFGPVISRRFGVLSNIIPHGVIKVSRMTVLLIRIMLIVLSRGIRAQATRIWGISFTIMVMRATTSVIKGFDWEEALILLVLSAILFSIRSAFNRAPLKLTAKGFVVSALTIVGIPLGIFLRHLYHNHQIERPFPDHGTALRHTFFYGTLCVILALTILFSRGGRLEFTPPTKEDVARYEGFLAKYDGNEYSHLFFLGDKHVFYSAKGNAILLYRPHRNSLIILDNPIGDEKCFEATIDEFIRLAEEHRMNTMIYELPAKYLTTCADQGFTFVKIGEDAMLNLKTYSSVGNKGRILRRMRNHMKREGTHSELIEPPFMQGFLDKVRSVSNAWINKREEMGFSLGRFGPAYLGRAPVAVVRNEKWIEGFASVMLASLNVASIDLMRIRPDASEDTMDGVLVSLIEWVHNTGYEYYNLGMAPLLDTGRAVYSGSKQKIVHYIYDFGSRAYNFKGLHSYKEKFRPGWTNRCLVYRNAGVLVSMLLSVLNAIHRSPQTSAIDVRGVLADFQTGRSSLLAKRLGRPTVDHGTGRPDSEGPRRGAPAAESSVKRDGAAAPEKSKVHKQKDRAIAPKTPIVGEARAQAESTRRFEPTPKAKLKPGSTSAPGTGSSSKPGAGSIREADADSGIKVESTPKSEAKPVPKSEAELAPRSEAEPACNSKTETEPESKTEADTRGQREAGAMSTPDVEAEEGTPARSEAEELS